MVSLFLHTPVWVFIIFVFLVALGLQQSRDRTISRWQLLLLPIAMLTFSLYGLVASFGLSVLVVLFWLVGCTVSAVSLRRPLMNSVQRLPSGMFMVTGSWWPLALMMVIFVIRYFLGYVEATQAQVSSNILPQWQVLISLMSGVVSGVFVARGAIGLTGLR